MEEDFWHGVWAAGNINFHKKTFNQNLVTFWDRLKVKPNGNVLVPLCGKSLDLIWLKNQGYHVFGFELSKDAVDQFVSENQLSPKMSCENGFELYDFGNLKIYCGDFFKLEKLNLPDFDACYDRASLVALPLSMRDSYYQLMKRVLPQGSKKFLLSFEYEHEKVKGPPFSVTEVEIRKNLEATFDITLHSRETYAPTAPKFVNGGVKDLIEKVYFLERT